MHIHWGNTLDAFENKHHSSLYMRIITQLLIFALWSFLKPFFKLEQSNLVHLEDLTLININSVSCNKKNLFLLYFMQFPATVRHFGAWLLDYSPTVDSFTVPLHGRQLTAVRAVRRDCHWGLKNSGNSHWSHEPIMHWGTRQSQSIFRPNNHKRVMPDNWRPCLIPHWQSYCHQARTV